MTDTVTVHVASRSPSATADGGTGEFKWRWDRMDAAQILASWVVYFAEDERVNLALTTVNVPKPEPGVNGIEVIDRWLDANWHLIEVGLEADVGALHPEPV